jgi:hypothetical protein
MKRLPRYFLWTLVTVVFMPCAFFLVASVSRGEVVADPPKIVEEAIKSAIAISALYLNVYWVHSVARREFEQRVEATREASVQRVVPLRSQVSILLSHTKPEFGTLPVEMLQENSVRLHAMERIMAEVALESEHLHHWIYSHDIRIANTFNVLLRSLNEIKIEYAGYRSTPESNSFSRFLEASERLRVVLDSIGPADPNLE